MAYFNTGSSRQSALSMFSDVRNKVEERKQNDRFDMQTTKIIDDVSKFTVESSQLLKKLLEKTPPIPTYLKVKTYAAVVDSKASELLAIAARPGVAKAVSEQPKPEDRFDRSSRLK